jgi:hypothetical protein
MSEPIDLVKELEKLAARHRLMADHAGIDWVWEARVRAAEELERRAADLRIGLMCSMRYPARRANVGVAPVVPASIISIGSGNDLSTLKHRSPQKASA